MTILNTAESYKSEVLNPRLLTAEQWASADGQLHEAAKYITDKSSPQAATLESYREKLRGIRRTERPLGVPDR